MRNGLPNKEMWKWREMVQLLRFNYSLASPYIVLILQLSGHVRRLSSKHYISRFTCLKLNRKTVLNSGNSAGTNSRRPALISKLTQKS